MPDRPPENPAQPEHIRRPGSASSIFQPKAMPSKSGRSVRRPSLRRREGCRRPRPKQTAYHPPEARREAPCPPPPHSRPAAKKRRTEKIVGYAEAPYVPAGGRTAHSSGHRIGGRSPAGARPPRGREASAPTAIPNTVFGATRDDRRAGFCTIRKYRHFYTPESALFRSDRGAVRHRRGRISGRGSLGKEYRYAGHCRPTAPYIGPAPTRLNVPASGGGGGLPKPAASDRTTIPPVRPRPTVLYRTRRRSRHFCRRASTSATQRTFHPSYRRTRTFDNRQTAPPSFAPSERKSSIREEGTAPPDTVSIRSGALPPSSPSARRFGLRFKQSGKNKSKPPGSVSSTAVEVPSEHAYSAASCNLEWQTTKTRQANESFAAASGEPLIRGKYENCND